jgi:3'-5' exoribonuclease
MSSARFARGQERGHATGGSYTAAMPPAVLRNQPICQWREGDFVQGFAFLAKKEHRQDRKGTAYLHLELQDSSGGMVGKVWADSRAILGRFDAPSYVAFEGLVQRHRDELQLNVRRCRTATEDDRSHGFDEGMLVPTTREDLDVLWARLQSALDRVERPALRRLVDETLQAWGSELRQHPAAKSVHHACRGGLLEHVVSMLEVAVALCEHYRELDRDLLLVGVLFHDLGKLRELGVMPASDYTREGRFIGHVVLGRDLLRERCASIHGFPGDLQLQLEHLVLSHHGSRELGAAVEPMTAEAMVLHYVDDLDSKLEQVRRARESASGFQYLRSLGRHLFLGDTPPPGAAPAAEPEPPVEERAPVQPALPGLLPED